MTQVLTESDSGNLAADPIVDFGPLSRVASLNWDERDSRIAV